MKNKSRIAILSLIALAIIGILSGASYAYFSVGNKQGNNTVIESGTMALTLTDGSTITIANLVPGSFIEKTFSVRNTGTVTTGYDIYLSEVVNTFVDQSDLVYEIISNDGGYSTSSQIQVPNTETKIINNYSINPSGEHHYKIRITYKLTNDNQNDNMGRTFIGKININEYKSTNKVIVDFDNNGGEGLNTPKVLSIGDIYGELPTPSKEGYTFSGWSLGNSIITSTSNVITNSNHILKANWVTTLTDNKVDYDYTGDVQTFIAPSTGTYKIELWGASSGSNEKSDSGKGGYVSGNIDLNVGESLYIYVGENGHFQKTRSDQWQTSTYNGGGRSSSNAGGKLGSGGGATDIRLINGNWNDFNSLKSRIMVAGAGGSGCDYSYNGPDLISNGASAGGLKGYDGIIINTDNSKYVDHIPPYGGDQILNNRNEYAQMKGRFGYSPDPTGSSSGGGGGYYGGDSGIDAGWSPSGGGGGSSFISGYSGCNAISSSSTSDNIIHTGQPNHYSEKVFTNGVMIDGKGCNWSTGSASNCGNNQPQPDGTTTIGHNGNGYARFTFME